MFVWFRKREVHPGPVAPDAFRLSPGADIDGTSLLAEVAAAPARLVEVFGQPGKGDGEKASGCYSFVDQVGNVFTVYDWKATSLYDFGDEDMEPAPTPEEYWASRNTDTLHIGGRRGSGNVKAFRQWLLDRLS